jgi:hypothetical protein
VSLARKRRHGLKQSHRELRNEIIRRQDEKVIKKDQATRNSLGRKLQKTSLDRFLTEQKFAVSECDQATLQDILDGNIIGKKLAHYWCINNKRVLFHGVVLRQMAQKKYKVEYWLDGHPRSESNKELISFHHLVVDFLLDDLVLS